MIVCDKCGETNKGRYKSFDQKQEDGTKKLVTWCYECLGLGLARWKSEKQLFDEYSVPFWKMMGAKPKKEDLAREKWMKKRGMSYGDLRRERDYYEAKERSAVADFNDHIKKYGRNNAPEVVHEKS